MGRFDECKRRAFARADELIAAIRKGSMNASAFEGVMQSYLEQPGYDETTRAVLLSMCVRRLEGGE